MKTIIKVEDISKLYSLKDVGAATIKSDLIRFWSRVRGKEDPAFLLAESNDRTKKGDSDFVWALKNINFEVKQGEVLGILGKNGAGKSTLLKILSRVVAPTTGQIKMKGRVVSLLEVGTGFHPDLSGRENIFLNGSIMGMSKKEIAKKFDEIVDFSGVERYIDTPVKRYSSGMYVRLAFAVAAHLEPEVLIIDEVLAVGDAEFQKKCIGKMKDVNQSEGRTVLFVSHNLSAIKSMCTSTMWIEKGQVKMAGEPSTVIEKYLGPGSEVQSEWVYSEEMNQPNRNSIFKIKKISLKNDSGNKDAKFYLSQPTYVDIEFCVEQEGNVNFSLVLSDAEGVCIFGSLNNHEPNYYGKRMEPGNYSARVKIPGDLLNNIQYSISLIGFSSNQTETFVMENLVKFESSEDGVLKKDYFGNFGGFIRPKLDWVTTKIG